MPFLESSIGMAQVPAWGDAIADQLFELLDLGKPPFFGARPDSVIIDSNLEYTSGARHERKLADVVREGR